MFSHKKMRKVSLLSFFLMGVCGSGASSGFANVVAALPEVVKPDIFRVNYDRIFIAEGASISIYCLENFKLIKKFGKLGEGPQEFKVNPPTNPMGLEIFPDHLVVHSMAKISYFSLDGKFIKDKAIPHNFARWAAGEHYVGLNYLQENNTIYIAINLYDSNLKKIREIYRAENQIQRDRVLELTKKPMRCQVVGDKIFVSAKKDFIIEIFDMNGKLLRTLKRDYRLVKVTEEDKKTILEEVKRELKQVWPVFKDKIKFGKYYPAIQTILGRGNKVYAPTFKLADGKFEIFVFDKDGNFLETLFLPLERQNPLLPYPYDFYRGKIYQLVENKDEKWELRVVEIK